MRYRGIFLNDEACGFKPWSTKNFDSEHPDAIGPKTYEKVFELQLRLRSNYIWPTVLGGSGPFSYYAENRKLADKYAMVVGSQHSEPLTSYGREWNEEIHGEYNYFTNRESILSFLEGKVEENKKMKTYTQWACEASMMSACKEITSGGLKNS